MGVSGLSVEETKKWRSALNKMVRALTWEEGTLIKYQRKMTSNMIRGEGTKDILPLVIEQKERVEELREEVKKILTILGLPHDASRNSKPGGYDGDTD